MSGLYNDNPTYKSERRVQYLVELETGVGFYKSGGYAVYTGHRWCATIREARAVAKKLRLERPLFHVRIMREDRRRKIVQTSEPRQASNPAGQSAGEARSTAPALLGENNTCA